MGGGAAPRERRPEVLSRSENRRAAEAASRRLSEGRAVAGRTTGGGGLRGRNGRAMGWASTVGKGPMRCGLNL